MGDRGGLNVVGIEIVRDGRSPAVTESEEAAKAAALLLLLLLDCFRLRLWRFSFSSSSGGGAALVIMCGERKSSNVIPR